MWVDVLFYQLFEITDEQNLQEKSSLFYFGIIWYTFYFFYCIGWNKAGIYLHLLTVNPVTLDVILIWNLKISTTITVSWCIPLPWYKITKHSDTFWPYYRHIDCRSSNSLTADVLRQAKGLMYHTINSKLTHSELCLRLSQ